MPLDLRRSACGLQFELLHAVVKLGVFFFITGLLWLNSRCGLLIQLGLDCLLGRSFNRIVGLLNRIGFFCLDRIGLQPLPLRGAFELRTGVRA